MYPSTIRTYCKLGRIHSAVLTGLAPVCTAAATGITLSLYHYLELFLIGFLFHMYLFVFNEVQDVEIDKFSKDLKSKPLINGSIRLRGARAVVISSCVLVLVLTPVFFFNKAMILIGISLVAFLLGWIYDTLGKKLPHADYPLGLMLFFVALYGGFSVTTDFNPFMYTIAILAFTQILIQNIVAGLKDVDHDFLAGGLSTSLRMGVRVNRERLIVSKRFIAYVFLLKIMHISLILLPFITGWIPYERWQLYIVILLITITIVFMIRLLTMTIFNREKIMRAIGFHEMFTFMIIPILLTGFIGYIAAGFLIAFPVIWLGVFLVTLYGRLMPAI
ncbi:MAG TPA: UbiA family prenyltransferase [Candidatus Thermoplasmatota archaeon]|nr:UbiA family prenyltransferase [Candidatus Thermoplasmatota archaeon]